MKRHPIPKELLDRSATTLRTVLEHFVSIEVAEYNHRATANETLPKTESDLLSGLREGAITFEHKSGNMKLIDTGLATRAICEAFIDGLILVFIDGKKVYSLEEPLDLREGSQVRLSSLRSW